VSPNKSWEGATASVVASLLFAIFYLRYTLPVLPVWAVAAIAVPANIIGQFGDLSESAIKRGAGVKDSGHMLPGHGGVLDRMDSSLFSLPTVYVVYLLLQNFLSF
jgi:phosphatidate cytidylyltransferase